MEEIKNKTKYEIWDLEKYKVGPNKYSDYINKYVYFDYWNREVAIREVFEATDNPEVKQVLRFAMELNNQYRKEAMCMYNAINSIIESANITKKLADDAVNHAYL